MRCLLAWLAVLGCAGVAATASPAARASIGDGCLVVSEGRGIVTISGRGTVFGHFDQGYVTIEDRSENDGQVPRVTGAEKGARLLSDTRTKWIGEDVRFRMSGRFWLRVEAVGIDLSVVGRATAMLTSADFLDAGFISVDADSFCEDGFQPMPDVPTRFTIGDVGTTSG
jgi:hypothetical protein